MFIGNMIGERTVSCSMPAVIGHKMSRLYSQRHNSLFSIPVINFCLPVHVIINPSDDGMNITRMKFRSFLEESETGMCFYDVLYHGYEIFRCHPRSSAPCKNVNESGGGIVTLGSHTEN